MLAHRLQPGWILLLLCLLVAGCASSGTSPPSEGLTDDWISAEVRRRIADEEDLSGLVIRVETRGRVVTLTGIVASLEQAREALRLAGRVRGVEQVVNRLRVIPGDDGRAVIPPGRSGRSATVGTRIGGGAGPRLSAAQR